MRLYKLKLLLQNIFKHDRMPNVFKGALSARLERTLSFTFKAIFF